MAVSGETPRFEAFDRRRLIKASYGTRWRRQRRFWFPAIIALVLVLVGLGSHITVQKAMKDMLAAKLETILAADVTGLVIWLDSQKQVVEELVQEPELAALIRDIAGARQTQTGDAKSSEDVPAVRDVRKILNPVCRRHGYADFLVINPESTIFFIIMISGFKTTT